jgi:flagellin FlaB
MISNFCRSLRNRTHALWLEQKGITGLETAIVLIAFVVVAAVFAFTVLTTGLFTSEKAKETALAGVAAASATMQVKGSVTADSAAGVVTLIRIKVGTAGTDAVQFNPTSIMVTYMDQGTSTLLTNGTPMVSTVDPPVCGNDEWCIRWSPGIVATNTILNPGQIAEIIISPDTAAPEANEQFMVEVIPQQGSTLVLSRRFPLSLSAIMNLN